MISNILTWFEQEATLLQAIAAGTAILGFGGAVIWGAFRLIRWAVTKPKPVQVEARVTFADEQTRLTMPEFLRMRKLLRDDIIAELDRADDEERRRLQARIDDLTAQINDPEGAFEAERKRLADLEDKLLREGNELGAERLNSAIAKLRAGNTDEAEAIFSEIAAREAMAVQRAARAEFGLGEIAESRVEWRAAAQHYARAAELEPDYEPLLAAGELLWRSGQYDAALNANKQLVEFSKDKFGPNNPRTALAQNNFAETLRALGQHEEALVQFKQALTVVQKAFGANDTKVGACLNNIAEVLRELHHYEEAEPFYQQGVEIGRATIAIDTLGYATSLNNYSVFLREVGRHNEAEPLIREALRLTKASLGERHPTVATRLNNLSLLLAITGRSGEAEELLREAIEIGRETLDVQHPDLAVWIDNLAGLLENTGRVNEATPLYLEALEIFRAALGDDHPDTQTVARNTLIHLREHAPDHPDRAALEAVFGTPDAP